MIKNYVTTKKYIIRGQIKSGKSYKESTIKEISLLYKGQKIKTIENNQEVGHLWFTDRKIASIYKQKLKNFLKQNNNKHNIYYNLDKECFVLGD